ncbi:SAM-dependent methyltransferase [Petralouisia muris]|jgi:SAM-dependent methyltransferase|uniref:SAM-dependent methyltransferase n=1 Tax=Petralouisia muris TaxID=3032872 RepID=A0AC61RWF0_9FIRM|nr:SAM-dependent methyltransferase [Petralouisia muris]TGY96239.1 SAM-dependent methyltransferase [Petralouisia muris]
MKDLHQFLDKYLNEQLQRMIISNPRNGEIASKIIIRPVLVKSALSFQASKYFEKKVFHKNYTKEEAAAEIANWMEKYRQLEISSNQGQAVVLISKRGRVTMKEKACAPSVKDVDLSHNRKKRYILDPSLPTGFLMDLGVQSRDGKIINAKYDKFRQINRFLEFIEDILPELPKDREVTILDFGCGKSYLTFAMYHYLKELKGYQVHIIGLDLKEDVIAECSRLAEKYGYDRLEFYVGDIAGYEGVQQVDMVVTLHACDTATDYALDKAIGWGAKVILSVPCCQHELNGQIENELLSPVLGYGLIKERMAALLTDALRAGILESRGYQVQILEFIDMEHTPKNILIRAVKKGRAKDSRRIEQVMEFLHVRPTLAALQEEKKAGESGKEERQNA